MDAQKDSGSGAQTTRNVIDVFAEFPDMLDKRMSHIWTDYVETNHLWDVFGGLEPLKTLVDYEHVVEPARARCSVTVARKDRARAKIMVNWGKYWDEEFNPKEFCLLQFAEYFLRHLTAIVRDGLSMQQA
jgi:hypothetical protein